MAGGRNRMITLGILFIAVLLAYRQRNSALEAAKTIADAASGPFHSPTPSSSNPSYPTQSHAPARGTSRRDFSTELFWKILSPLPYLWQFTLYLFRQTVFFAYLLSPLLVQPLLGLWHMILVLLSPMIILLQALNYYLILIPMGIALGIGRTLYPLYVFAMVAVLFGGVIGALGGWFHWGLISPVTGKTSIEVQGEIHREIRQLVDGKAALKRGRKGKGRSAGTEREEFGMSGHMEPGMSRVKEEELRGWRDSVW